MTSLLRAPVVGVITLVLMLAACGNDRTTPLTPLAPTPTVPLVAGTYVGEMTVSVDGVDVDTVMATTVVEQSGDRVALTGPSAVEEGWFGISNIRLSLNGSLDFEDAVFGENVCGDVIEGDFQGRFSDDRLRMDSTWTTSLCPFRFRNQAVLLKQ